MQYRKPQINTVGLVAHYKLWAGLTSSGKVFDYSLNGFEGTLTGTNIAPAYPGFRLNGTDDYIDVGTGPGSVNTVLLWVNPADIAGNDYVIETATFNFLVIATGTLTATGFSGGTQVLYTDGVAGTTVTANWHLIGITTTVSVNADNLEIGRARPAGVEYLDGLIGETLLFDRVLSAPDVKSVYELTRWRYGV